MVQRRLWIVGAALLVLCSVLAASGCVSQKAVPGQNGQIVGSNESSNAAATQSAGNRQSPHVTVVQPQPSSGQTPTQVQVAGSTYIRQGDVAIFMARIYSPSERTGVCGAVNYYIDNYAAGGTWNINPQGSCSSSSGSLILSGLNTTKLSVGTRTLKVDWLGDNLHGPSQAAMTFTVISGPGR